MKLLQFKFEKLVRDKISKIMRETGIIVHERVLQQDEYIKQLKNKLLEEASEVEKAEVRDELVEELADVLDVVYALARASSISIEDIEHVRQKKLMQKGGFNERVYIEAVEVEEINPVVNYYRLRPEQYAEKKVCPKKLTQC